ncbi:MAG: HlyD family efflux transporter periplasmic adaptor subunit [Candidatus Aminicenantes bacterium]|nr:HlyD family efflux transporter periplasmic adaptor subunit [Candidatus Aminicenantes bacterium]
MSHISTLGKIVLVLIVLFHAGCGPKEEGQETAPPIEDIRPVQVVGIGRIEPELKLLDIASQVSGFITQIPFQPGDMVEKDRVIIELDSAVEKARIAQAEARIQTQIAQVDAARAALSPVKVRMENAKTVFERTKNLFEQGTETQFTFDKVKADYEALLEEIKGLEAGVVTAERLVRQYRADLVLFRAEYEKRFIRAPTDGQLLSLDITLGSLVTPQKSFGTFAPASSLSARCEIDELFATEVQSGQKAYVRLQGTTEPLAHGTVSFAGPYLRRKSIFSDEVGDLQDRRVREVRITLDPGTYILLGSRVECVILLKDSER